MSAFEPTGQRPLHPLDLGGIANETIRLYREHFLSLVAIVAIVQVIIAILVAIVVHLILHGNVVLGVIAGLVTGVLTLIGIEVQSGALTVSLADDYLGRPITVQRALSAAVDRIGSLVGTSLLVGVLVGLMAITVIGIPFAIYFGIRWVFIAQVVMLENRAGTAAMQRSGQLVQGFWWRTFGILLLVGIIIGVISDILTLPFGQNVSGDIVRLVVQIILTPIAAAVATLLYFDMRVRKEDLTHGVIAGSLPGSAGVGGVAPGPTTV